METTYKNPPHWGAIALVIAALFVSTLIVTYRYLSVPMSNSAMLAANQQVKLQEQDALPYFAGAQGFYAAPADGKDHPGVVMVHEWWGLNSYIRDMARVLARQGYQVLAVDLYHGQVATTADAATKLVGAVKPEESVNNLKAAVAYLRDHKAAKVASLGWCFGGGQVLKLDTSGEKLDATVVYYGAPLITDETQLKKITEPVLGVFGDKDQVIPLDSIHTFQKSLNDLNIKNSINIYTGLGHAFANPSGMGYAPAQTKDAWAKTLQFLDINLQK